MNRRWLFILLGVLGLLTVYEIFNNQFSFFMLVIGVLMIFVNKRVSKEKSNTVLFIGIISILLAILSSRIVLAVIIIGAILFIGNHPELFQTVREGWTNRKNKKDNNDFIVVQFDEENEAPARMQTNRWFGNDEDTTEEVFSWEDINFTKIAGNTVFDLGNTILPKEQNIILIRVGIGDTKIILPEEAAISLDVSMLNGQLIIGQEEISMNNETFKWQSERYNQSARKVKLVANVFVGKVEVVFL
jgi:predicted membrane protein